ncbi:hypothetical protein [Caballeronia sp. Lep1P3]|uniref:hypothetical protein n=1 Tax=Caballeronia sp. Lep1P3 TaxID=2878150 RepID=UPI001FD39DC0|nr:hypothetical protein [Caballeronia sp. Lep1P3]
MIKQFAAMISLLIVCGVYSKLAVADTEYAVENGFVKLVTDGTTVRLCELSEKPIFAVLSFDKSAIIVSDTGYADTQELQNCSATVKVKVSHIPEGVGFLSDINLSKGIYVSLDFVSVQPFTWLATIARIGTTKNLLSLHGVFQKGKALRELRKYSFDSIGEAGASVISVDGDFVAPNGKISCRVDSYPGVWDLKRKKRVIADEAFCARIFQRRIEPGIRQQ